MTLASLLAELAPSLAPSADLAWLLSGFLGCSVPELTLHLNKELNPAEASLIRAGIPRLTAGEPPQYILGTAWFWGLELRVDPHVLIPRPETEGLVEIALSLLKPSARVLEIGTGSGAIAIALAKTRPDLTLTATDISADALDLARDNAARHGCAVAFVQADLFPGVDTCYDLVISNPPYVSAAEYGELDPQVRDFEPPLALLAGEDGLAIFRRVFARLRNYLSDQGLALFEHGALQRESVIALGASAGFTCFLAKDDLAGRNRYLGFEFGGEKGKISPQRKAEQKQSKGRDDL